ncbi:MAG: FAD-binding oxidoreductase [Pseudomonadota bacterium]
MTDTIYGRDAPMPLPSEAPLPAQTGVLIVGGGLTGTSAALHLAEHGRKVTLVDMGGIGDGASGRNGGQLHPGMRRDQVWLAKTMGPKMADALWRLGAEAVALVHALRVRLQADCGWRPGLIEAAHTEADFDHAKRYAEYLNESRQARHEVLDRSALSDAIGSSRYCGAIRDPAGGHLNPLALVNAISSAAHVKGARLHAGVRAVSQKRTRKGWEVTLEAKAGRHTVIAEELLLAGNGYMRGLSPFLDARILPLRNHILATAPLGKPLIPGGEAVADSRFVVRYFRQDTKGRMVFGGGESYRRTPRDVARFVRPYLLEVYPQLAAVPVEAAWSGTLGISRLRMPIIRRLEPGLYVAAGFSGQGVGLGTFAGKVVADAIAGEGSRLEVLSRVPAPPFPGGPLFKTQLGYLAMMWYSARDHLGF